MDDCECFSFLQITEFPTVFVSPPYVHCRRCRCHRMGRKLAGMHSNNRTQHTAPEQRTIAMKPTHGWAWTSTLFIAIAFGTGITYPDNNAPPGVDVWCGKAYRANDGHYSMLHPKWWLMIAISRCLHLPRRSRLVTPPTALERAAAGIYLSSAVEAVCARHLGSAGDTS